MIIPILQGLVSWSKAPVTWMIVLLNVVVLHLSLGFGQEASDELDALMDKDYFVETQGRAYAQYLAEQSPARYPRFLLSLADHVLEGQRDRVNLLGQLAFRDKDFLEEAPITNFKGDQVAFKYWKSKLKWSKHVQESHPSFILGLNADDFSLSKWVTYIFIHSGWIHLVGNMLFLLIFGAFLERQIGGLALLVVFVLSGVLGAGVFAVVTGVTTSPLVGASGAVSGVMTLYCVLNWKKPARFVYWLFLPVRGYMGLIYLPAWVSLAMWFAADLAGYLSSVPELGGVAHTAHLGGELAGVVAGLIVFAVRRLLKLPSHSSMHSPDEDKVIGVLYPFLPPEPVRKAAV